MEPSKARRASDSRLLTDIEQRTFEFFWERVNHRNGLMPDRWPAPSPCSIAATGFALSAWPIGVERRWITRDQACDITLRALRFMDQLPQGEQPSGTSGYRGFFYHFLDVETGLRFGQSELSTADTSWLQLGMAFAQSWFNQENDSEKEIRALAQRLLDRTRRPQQGHKQVAQRIAIAKIACAPFVCQASKASPLRHPSNQKVRRHWARS